ncbi:hypothetical protein DHEL01_v211276 [Diaporthe helianthi]|uniref:Uncharacterized protein n=1 Tax=Diaporthe helianthi TaxID=158607 RepID=A0A2P5HJE4_DIAHE|nr:hypothetical protein DHEL01_v211276 [Diaporthe helianthi]
MSHSPPTHDHVTLVEQNDNSVSASKILGTGTYSLQFALVEPPALVVPNDDYVPKGEAARATLEALQHLRRLPDGDVKTITGVANLVKLYGGKGGQVLGSRLFKTAEVRSDRKPSASAEKASLVAAPHEHPLGKDPAPSKDPAKFPPSYDDLGHSPPSYPPSNKRLRLDSGSQLEVTRHTGLKMEEICRQGFNEIGRRLDHIENQLGTLGSRLDRVEQRMSSLK